MVEQQMAYGFMDITLAFADYWGTGSTTVLAISGPPLRKRVEQLERENALLRGHLDLQRGGCAMSYSTRGRTELLDLLRKLPCLH